VKKTLTIRDEVYERLLKIKREDESFSDLFMRLSEEENTLHKPGKRLLQVACNKKPSSLRRLHIT
jgi:predicted CopG family antitoxin